MSGSENIQQELINQIPIECREIGKKFFECIANSSEDIIKSTDVNSYEQLEKIIEEKIFPICIEKYDLEKCVEQLTKKWNQWLIIWKRKLVINFIYLFFY